MDVTTTYNPSAAIAPNKNDNDKVVSNPKAILGKDDFLKLLLIELQYQDPTDPMDSDKILTQTSELASLEAADNTNKALQTLSKTLTQTSGLSVVSAIGKMGSLGTDTILLDEQNDPSFDLYFAENVENGILRIEDLNGNIVNELSLNPLGAGVQSFTWDGTNNAGNRVTPGSYRIVATYTTATGETKNVHYGSLPIESVRFDNGTAEVKMGSHYYPIDKLKEIYEG